MKSRKSLVLFSDTPQNSPLKHDHNQNQQQGLAGSHLIRQRQMNAAANRNTSPGSTTMNNGTSSGHGFRTRKLSNCSSVASDMSFRLPHYDANSSVRNFHRSSCDAISFNHYLNHLPELSSALRYGI